MESIELCAGAGGQALGLERSGFDHLALVEIDESCRQTLSLNRPYWNVVSGAQSDLELFDGKPYHGVDLVAGGLPCPPFSVAGKQLGKKDERNLFPHALRVVSEVCPKAVLIENVRGFLDPIFADYREELRKTFRALGYQADWRLLNARDFGVSQSRPRVAIIAMRNDLSDKFVWPTPLRVAPLTVGKLLLDQMKANNWVGAESWAQRASAVAPTIVGGSKKHGGPDLGPTRARAAWAVLGVDGRGIANESPTRDFVGMPRLTTQMVARIQGFADDWQFYGKKTATYRQIGNAFPPPVATALGQAINLALGGNRQSQIAVFA